MFGLLWTLVALLPTIFFTTDHWWQPLASRYTYLPRVGVVVALAGTYAGLRQQIARWAVVGLIVAVAVWQTLWWSGIVARDYDYVYRTGRSLQAAVRSVQSHDVSRILIAPDRPFEGNLAHIIGAFVALGGFREEEVIFLNTAHPTVGKGEALLKWDPAGRQYDVSFGE